MRTACNSSGLLSCWEVRKGGSTSFELCGFLGNYDTVLFASLRWIPNNDLVIITRADDIAILGIESPNFTIRVRAHDLSSFGTTWSVPDGSVTSTDEEVSVEDVDRSHEVIEVDFRSDNWEAISRAVPLDNLTVLASGIEVAVMECKSSNHSLIVA